MQVRITRVAGLATILSLSMVFGMAVQKFHLPPYEFFAATYNYIGNHLSENTEEEFPATNVNELISIKATPDVARVRSDLIRILWGDPGLPANQPASVSKNISDNRYDDISSLSRIDKITVAMEYGIESNAFHFIPKEANNKIVLFHEGHDGDFHKSRNHIKEFLDKGYSVVGFCMPLIGLNNQPTIELPRLGKLRLERHDHMKFLTPKDGHPIKYFIEPVVVVVNYIRKNYNDSTISMVGISGGGWTTTLASAVDDRIQKSFSVAGSYPIHIRSSAQKEWGDYEQTEPEIYQTVNYLDLYILDSYGNNREHLQIINQYDTCCFSGTKSELYKDAVKNRVAELGAGRFDLFLDDTHREHAISNAGMDRIMDRLLN